MFVHDGESTERARGRRGVQQRQRRLSAEPICRHCIEQGRITLATVPDHIVPLSRGGTDQDGNIQCLCIECHRIKSAGEAQDKGVATHPGWLQPSAVPLTIVCGPPAAGKTTYARQAAQPGDLVIDLDDILAKIKPHYRPWSGDVSREELTAALRTRNAMLGSLERRAGGKAWFIVMAPSQAERKWWQRKLGGDVVLLNPGMAECKQRAINRQTPNAVMGIDAWDRSSKSPWLPPAEVVAKQTIGVDGWPVET